MEVNRENVLLYGDYTVAELVYNDTDQDGVPDWEEVLWGLDPDNRETTPGVPDITTVNKLKVEQEASMGEEGNLGNSNETLTETDKFSRELFSTIAALNEAGVMDQSTVEQISSSLAEHIKNSTQRKIYTLSDIRVLPDNSVTATKKFNDTLNGIYVKYPIQGSVMDILQKFVIDENDSDSGNLSQLGPIIKETRARMNAMSKIEVPQNLSLLYLDVLNMGEKVVENLEDIQLYDADPIVALGGIAQYEKSTTSLGEALGKLIAAINQRLKI